MLIKKRAAILPQFEDREPEIAMLAAILKHLPGFEAACENEPQRAYHNVVRLIALARQRNLTLEGTITYTVARAKECGMSISKTLTQELGTSARHDEAPVIAYIDTPLYSPDGLPIKVTGRAGVTAEQIIETVWAVAEAGRRLLEEGYYTRSPSGQTPPPAEMPVNAPVKEKPSETFTPPAPPPQRVTVTPSGIQTFPTIYGNLALEQRVDALVTGLKLTEETNKFGKSYLRLHMCTREGATISIPGWNDGERRRMHEFFTGGQLVEDYWFSQAPRDSWIELPAPVYVALKIARNKDGSPRLAEDGIAYLDYIEVLTG